MEEIKYDVRFQHPFSCIVAGPSNAGKTTLVKSLIDADDTYIDVQFDIILLFIGTKLKNNKLFKKLQEEKGDDKVIVFELLEQYPGRAMSQFTDDFKSLIATLSGQKILVVFDDLMQEISECGLLVNLFTKWSSHLALSVIFITQNPFFKAKGCPDNTSVYRNSNYIICFKFNLDSTILNTIARRQSSGSYKEIAALFDEITSEHRYVLIDGKLCCPKWLKYRTNLVAQEPLMHQIAYVSSATFS